MTFHGGGVTNSGVIFSFDTNAVASINELTETKGSIYIYPNPSNGIFTIAFSHPELASGSQIIEVYNVLGEQVYSQFNIQNSTLL